MCEKQLFHLIDRVKNIEVNESEIDSFLPNIYEKLSGLDREELIKKFVSMEFNSFLSYYENAQDLNDLAKDSGKRSGKGSSENMTRFFINLGRKDKLNPARLIGLINDQNITEALDIGAIDILDTFSFFEVDKNFEQQTLEAFSDNQPEFSGRSVNIEITRKEKPTGGGRRKGRRPFKDSGNRNGGSRRGGGKNNSGRSNDRNPSTGFGRRRKKR